MALILDHLQSCRLWADRQGSAVVPATCLPGSVLVLQEDERLNL